MDSLQRIFVTVDPATSSKFGPGDILTWRKQPSYSVISIWALTMDYHLLWLDMVRFRREAPDVILAMKNVNRRWKPDYFMVEGNGVGMPILQAAAREGLTVQPIITRNDKVTNATEAMIRMSQGRIWFPEEASWLSTAEDEIFFWTGAPTETDDIVDTLSNAARNVSWDDGAVMPSNPENPSEVLYEGNDLPSIIDDLHGSGYSNENPFGSYYS
jgi:predicted phage terminase large subunit-like protein